MNTYLDTAISLVLIFMIFSIVTYVLQELLAINLKYRGKMLWRSIAQLLDGYTEKGRDSLNKALPRPDITPNTTAFFIHPEIRTLHKNLKKLPSYIPANNFALAIMDRVAAYAPPGTAGLFNKFQAGINLPVIPRSDFNTILKNLSDASADVNELQNKIEKWFNDYMDRVTGWYQSYTVLTVRLIAIAVTLFFNLNIIKLTKEIATNSQLRASLVGIAEKVTDHPDVVSAYYTKTFDQITKRIDDSLKIDLANAKTVGERDRLQQAADAKKELVAKEYTSNRIAAIDSLTKELSAVHLPLGWKTSWKQDFTGANEGDTAAKILLVLLGWSIAVGCLSMGAPFWFNLLVKLVNIRRSGIKPTAKNSKRQ